MQLKENVKYIHTLFIKLNVVQIVVPIALVIKAGAYVRNRENFE